MTLKELSEASGITVGYLTVMIRRGKLKGTKNQFGRWIIGSAEAARIAALKGKT